MNVEATAENGRDEAQPSQDRATAAADRSRWLLANRLCATIITLLIVVFFVGYSAITLARFAADGGIPPILTLIVLSVILIASCSSFLANFRLPAPKSILVEALLLTLILYASFALYCLSAYFRWGDFWGHNVILRSVILEFCSQAVKLTLGCVLLSLLISAVNCVNFAGRLYDRWMEKGMSIKYSRPMKKIADFIDRHPSLIASSAKEYVELSVRYAIWGAMLSMLVLKTLDLAHYTFSSLIESSSPAYDSNFNVETFAGEKLGRILSGDMEKKKLSRPIGPIDELMLRSDGDPERRLICVHGQKYLGPVHAEEADRLAAQVCASLRKTFGFELKSVPPCGREGYRRLVLSDKAYALVTWSNLFFQKEKLLCFYVCLREKPHVISKLNPREVMGHRLGTPARGDGKPQKQFWKFERVVDQCGANDITDAAYAVHDVSSLSLEEAEKELEEAKEAVERLHGIKLFKCLDYDDAKQYYCYGKNVDVSVRLEWRQAKQIRYSVHATGKWQSQIHKMPPGGISGRMSSADRAMFWLCGVMLVSGGLLIFLRRRKPTTPQQDDTSRAHP